MQRTIKLSTDGADQLVRLTNEFRFDGDEVVARKDAQTGEIILSPVNKSLDHFFQLVSELTQEERDAFVIPPRDRSPMRVPDLSE